MDVSIRQLRAQTKEIIDTVNRGVPVTIKSHGRSCAQLIPIKRERIKPSEDPAFGMWKNHEESADVLGYVRKLREGRKL